MKERWKFHNKPYLKHILFGACQNLQYKISEKWKSQMDTPSEFAANHEIFN